MNETARQKGFLLTSEGKLTLRRESGSRMIKPKEKKGKRKKSDVITPFQEILRLERIVRQRTKILEEYHAHEDMNGSLYIMRRGAMSLVGPDETAEFLKDVSMNRPDFPPIPVLSQKAHDLQYALNRRKLERGPLKAQPLPHAGNLDAFGNLLKK